MLVFVSFSFGKGISAWGLGPGACVSCCLCLFYLNGKTVYVDPNPIIIFLLFFTHISLVRDQGQSTN